MFWYEMKKGKLDMVCALVESVLRSQPFLLPAGRGLKSHAYIHSVQFSHHARWSISCLPSRAADHHADEKGRNTSLGPTCVLGAHTAQPSSWLPQGLPASKTRHPHNSLFPGFSEPEAHKPTRRCWGLKPCV